MRKAVIALTAFMGGLVIILGAGSASAWAAQAESVRGTLRNQGQPVQGIKIDVATQAGQPVGSDTTDARGRWEIEVPSPGTYRVTLAQNTLPQGVALRLQNRGTLVVRVFEEQNRNVAFLLGQRQAPGGGNAGDRDNAEFARVAQLLFDGLNFGLIIALAALGLSLVFGTTGLTNFAHGELLTLGAILTYFTNAVLGMPLLLAAVVTVAGCAAFGYLQDRFFWGRLRRRGTGLIAMMIVSIGMAILLRNLYLYLYGGRTRSYADYGSQPGWELGPITAPPKVLIGMAVAVAVLITVGLALLFTRLGKATRAVSDNPALAASSGINVELVIRTVWTVGTAIAGLGGMLFGLSFGVQYQMGFATLLLVFAGTILGGLGTAFGALVGSLIVGVFIQLSTLVIPTELKNAGALLVLILVLLFRPQGVLGRRERVG